MPWTNKIQYSGRCELFLVLYHRDGTNGYQSFAICICIIFKMLHDKNNGDMPEWVLSLFDRTFQTRMSNVEKTQHTVVIETQKKSKNCRSALPERCAFAISRATTRTRRAAAGKRVPPTAIITFTFTNKKSAGNLYERSHIFLQ